MILIKPLKEWKNCNTVEKSTFLSMYVGIIALILSILFFILSSNESANPSNEQVTSSKSQIGFINFMSTK